MSPPGSSAVVATFREASKHFTEFVNDVFQEFAAKKAGETKDVIESGKLEAAAIAVFKKAQIQLTDVEVEGITRQGTDVGIGKSEFSEIVYEVLHNQIVHEMGLLRQKKLALTKCVETNTSSSAPANRPAVDRIPNFKGEQNIFIVDVGTAESGFYAYTIDANSVKATNTKKVPVDFLNDCIGKQDADLLVNLVNQEFKTTEGHISFGLTGANREKYLNDPEPFNKLFDAVKKRIPKLHWFILSAKKEAQSEFAAVQYLAEKCGFGKVDAVIGAGSGSCQASSSNTVSSIPVGNKTPDKEPLVGTSSQDKIYSWIARVASEINKANMQQLPGTFVGISAMFHAAKAANIAGSALTKKDAISGFDAALTKMVAENDARNMYNVAMARTLLLFLLADDGRIFFQRNWVIGDEEFVANWTLGLVS